MLFLFSYFKVFFRLYRNKIRYIWWRRLFGKLPRKTHTEKNILFLFLNFEIFQQICVLSNVSHCVTCRNILCWWSILCEKSLVPTGHMLNLLLNCDIVHLCGAYIQYVVCQKLKSWESCIITEGSIFFCVFRAWKPITSRLHIINVQIKVCHKNNVYLLV